MGFCVLRQVKSESGMDQGMTGDLSDDWALKGRNGRKIAKEAL